MPLIINDSSIVKQQHILKTPNIMKKMEAREKKLLHGITIVFSIAVIGLTIALVILGKLS